MLEQRNTTPFVVAMVAATLGVIPLRDAVAQAPFRPCDRSITLASMSASDREVVVAGRQRTWRIPQPNGYDVDCTARVVRVDPELVMCVFSQADQHVGAGGLGDFVKQSKFVGPRDSNPYRVFYEQHVTAPYENASYTVENSIRRFNDGFILDMRLVDSSNASFSPSKADAFFSATSVQGKGSLVVACNAMVPRNSSLKAQFNDLAFERLHKSAEHLHRWVGRVANDPTKAAACRARLATLVPPAGAR